MGKKAKRRQKPKPPRPPQQASLPPLKFYQLESPVKGRTKDEILQMLRAGGASAEQEFAAALAALQQKILQFDPNLLLSIFAFYGLSSLGPDEWSAERPILQHHVELLQALLLRHPADAFAGERPMPEDVSEIVELLEMAARGFQFKRLASLDTAVPEKDRLRFVTLETIRSETQAVRGWGYPDQVHHEVAGAFATVDDQIQTSQTARADAG